MRSDTAEDPNKIPSQFPLVVKHTKHRPDIHRAGFVVRDHREREEGHVFNNVTMLKWSSLPLFLSLASVIGFDVYLLDVI